MIINLEKNIWEKKNMHIPYWRDQVVDVWWNTGSIDWCFKTKYFVTKTSSTASKETISNTVLTHYILLWIKTINISLFL